MKQTNQWALVTGGISGIGYELAELLAADKHNLILVARTQDDLDRVAGEKKASWLILQKWRRMAMRH